MISYSAGLQCHLIRLVMFNHNPWVIYATVVGPILILYYLFIILRFYRRALTGVFLGETLTPIPPYVSTEVVDPPVGSRHERFQDEIPSSSPLHLPQIGSTTQAFSLGLEELTQHLKGSLEEAHLKQYDREDIILLLQLTLKDYSALISTPFQATVNDLIDAECAKYGSISLTEQDKMMAWEQVD
jgi:hypothetical protein